MAWHVEFFARQKRLPSLNKVLGRAERTAPAAQTADEMIAAMDAWAALSAGNAGGSNGA